MIQVQTCTKCNLVTRLMVVVYLLSAEQEANTCCSLGDHWMSSTDAVCAVYLPALTLQPPPELFGRHTWMWLALSPVARVPGSTDRTIKTNGKCGKHSNHYYPYFFIWLIQKNITRYEFILVTKTYNKTTFQILASEMLWRRWHYLPSLVTSP